ncbi:TetR/AcrR family transcriptional regulator [Nocardioides marinus]|uniref:AcrR family transcriptional regulator n=1 Tax=Nocardioides marinus TaxID=374514 RepID=A0A7Z0C3P5_9ACTN|nr:AcrR family transcriptional regulator [Nocardioides marinus]
MTPRDGYHHGNLREALVDAAVELAGASGPEGVVLRAVTRRVGVSPNAAYRHFADREALLTEVASRAMAALTRSMVVRQDAVAEPDPVVRAVARLEAIGRGYVDFALAEPGLFRVCFAAPPEVALAWDSRAEGEPAPDPTADPFGVLNAALDELVDVGWLDPVRRTGAEVLCWSTVHGFATLHLDGPLRDATPEEREHSLALALAHVSRGLGPA